MDTVVFTSEEGITYFTNEVLLVKINGDVDTAIAAQYHISGYPTTVLVNKDGEEIDRIVGYAPTEEFIGQLEDYRHGIGTLADLLQRADTVDDRTLYYEIADKYKYRGGKEEAVRWFQKVIAAGEPTDSLSGESQFAIADLYHRERDYDTALMYFKQMSEGFEGQPLEEIADIYIAVVYRRMGDTANAISAFEKFVETYPESEDTEYAKGQIEKLKGNVVTQ